MIVTINKDGDKIGSFEEYWVEGCDMGMFYEEGYNVCPCFESDMFQIGDKCPATPLDFFLGNFNIVLNEDMVEK